MAFANMDIEEDLQSAKASLIYRDEMRISMRIGLVVLGATSIILIVGKMFQLAWPLSLFTPVAVLVILGVCFIGALFILGGVMGGSTILEIGDHEISQTIKRVKTTNYCFDADMVEDVKIETITSEAGQNSYRVLILLKGRRAPLRTTHFSRRPRAEDERVRIMLRLGLLPS